MFRWLPEGELQALHTALMDSGLDEISTLRTLAHAVDTGFRGRLPDQGTPATRLMTTLDTLNQVENLRNGSVPFLQWLERAVFLAGQTASADPIRDAYRRIGDGTTALPADLPPTVDAPAFDGSIDEALLGPDDTVGVAFLEGGVAAARSVAKIVIHRHQDGEPQFSGGNTKRLTRGTGWLIAPGLLVTNHHVINGRVRVPPFVEADAGPADLALQARTAELIFDYYSDPSTSAEILSGPHELIASDKDLDFAMLRLARNDRPSLRLGPHRIKKRIEQALGTRVNLLQHPNGKPMRLGFRDNFVVMGDDHFLTYLTDTEGGSSGSPVFDDEWLVAALHRGARSIDHKIELRGKRITSENYGTQVLTILERLETLAPGLRGEILAHQGLPANP